MTEVCVNLQASLGPVTVTFARCFFFVLYTFHYTGPTGCALSIFIKRAGKITYITRFLQGKVDEGAPVYKSARETQGVMGEGGVVTATTVLCFHPNQLTVNAL